MQWLSRNLLKSWQGSILTAVSWPHASKNTNGPLNVSVASPGGQWNLSMQKPWHLLVTPGLNKIRVQGKCFLHLTLTRMIKYACVICWTLAGATEIFSRKRDHILGSVKSSVDHWCAGITGPAGQWNKKLRLNPTDKVYTVPYKSYRLHNIKCFEYFPYCVHVIGFSDLVYG